MSAALPASPPGPVLVTGAGGYLGRRVVQQLAAAGHAVVGTDITARPDSIPSEITWVRLDIRDRDDVHDLITQRRPAAIVHLAAIVNPPKGAPPTLAWEVDVHGTQNVLAAALAAGTQKLIVTSSGAAYGYYPDNAPAIREDAPIRGNAIFAYSHHKRIVEGLLAEARLAHPELHQLILRVGTILGAHAQNQITAIFERPVIMGLTTTASPFNFIWDEDVAAIIVKGAADLSRGGIYNVAGSGTMTLADIARALGKRYIAVPPALVAGALGLLTKLGIAPYGPEQVIFLEHRPVLDNRALIEDFGFTPKSTHEVFAIWQNARA